MIESIYTSSNCNQTPTAVDWGQNNLICYASCNAVLIYDPNFGSGGKVVKSLTGHKQRVNSVKWLSKNELVSGSSDGDVIYWCLDEDSNLKQILKGHESIVNIVDGLYKEQDIVVASASMDSTVRIWNKKSDSFTLTQTINCGYNICVGLKLSFINSNSLIMACAMDTSKIQLYIENEETVDISFVASVSLKGHENWVRGIDFTKEGNDILLTSASQDAFVRLWRITEHIPSENETNNDKKTTNIFKKEVIKTTKHTYRVFLESVLSGHEGWVYSARWSPRNNRLLTASLDKTMVIWEHDKESGLWLEKVRVGEVGGNTLGFYGGTFNPQGDQVLGYSYHGAFHIWKNRDDIWTPVVTVGGHHNEVVDIGWDPAGEFLVSLSTDQTTRIHAPWSNGNNTATWHEIARPQVHGYDMSSLAILSRYKYASSSEEKVIRTFKAPKNFVDNLGQLCNIEDDPEGDLISNSQDAGPKGASVPSLGLSNKAVFTNDNLEQVQQKNPKDMYPEESHFTCVDLKEPPTEETLLQNTLWPEVQKLYGHGYEVFALAASKDGKYLASSCKATTLEHASVLLWDTTNWKQIQKLTSHTLTVVQISFSPDSNHILTVSRDRRWSVFSKTPTTNTFDLVATTDKKTSIHTRIIWCCDWSHDSKYFATGSRDGKLVMWTRNEEKKIENVLGQYEAVGKFLNLASESVTAVAFAPDLIKDSYLVGVGLETGVIHLFKWTPVNGFNKVTQLTQSMAHQLTVKRILFRPKYGEAGQKKENRSILQFASCSSDFSVKVFNISVDKL